MDIGKGVFIVIEGTDGSGKGTQFKRLADRLAGEGYDVATFDFPQYDQPSSYFVREYLNGKYGSAEDVGPYTGSLFYALDRYQAAPHIRKALDEGKVVLANRYVGSNMAHQGTKFRHAEERRGYFIWLDNLEFEMLRSPRPTISFVLRVPAEVAQGLVDQKETRSYTDKKRDLHEADLDHLKNAVAVYDDMCELFPKDFSRIDCTRNNELLSIDTIHEIIWQKVEPMLPTGKPATKNSPAQTLPDPSSSSVATPESMPTQTEADAPESISEDASTHLAPASPSIMQQASQLLASKIQRSRHISYSQEPLYIGNYDQKDEQGRYRYFTPEHLDPAVTDQYHTHMDKIFDLYSEIVHVLTSHLIAISTTPKDEQDAEWRKAIKKQAHETARAVLPVATTSATHISSAGEGLEDVIRRLLGDPLPEGRKAVETILSKTKVLDPTFLDRLNEHESGAIITYRAASGQKVSKLAKRYLSENHSSPTSSAQLTSVWPRNELDIVPDILYPHSDLALREIEGATKAWPYDQKVTVVEAYLGERASVRQRPGRVLEKIHYNWDLMSDFATFRDLQLYQQTEAVESQELTPRFGYDVPKLVEDADLLDQFETAFELSLRLYSLLQESGYQLEAQYATLLGHKMRWQITYNAREAFRIHEGVLNGGIHPATTQLVQTMHTRLSEVHPLLGEAIKFVESPTSVTTAATA